jgi:hypothetical protein
MAQGEDPGDTEAPEKLTINRADKRKLRRLFGILKKEPTVQEVQRAATGYFDLDPDRVRTLARNARLKGLIPNVQVRFTNSISDEFRNTRDGLYVGLPGWPDLPNPSSFKEVMAQNSDSLSWEVSAQFDLDRLVFSAEALDAKSLTSLSESLIRELTTLYYSRRRVIISLVLSPPSGVEEYLYELTRLDELTAPLDALTGGMFERRAWRWEDSNLVGLPSLK